jgi:hypothetical protein
MCREEWRTAADQIQGSQMTKNQKADEFARKMYPKWVATNRQEALAGRKEFDAEWIMAHAWRVGFDAGQAHQRKITREKKNG